MKKWTIFLLCLFLAGCARTYDGPTEQKRVLLCSEAAYVYGDSREVYSRTEYSYDALGNLASYHREQYDHVDAGYYEYDALGREVRRTIVEYKWFLPILDHRTVTAYDPQGNVLTEDIYSLWKHTRHEYTYNEHGDNTGVHTTGESSTIHPKERVYDGSGNISRVIWPSGGENRYFYDSEGRNIRREDWAGGGLRSSTEIRYDAEGRVVQEITGGDVTRWEYDDEAGIVSCIYPTGMMVCYHYDEFGKCVLTQTFSEDSLLIDEYRSIYGYIQVPAGKGAVS